MSINLENTPSSPKLVEIDGREWWSYPNYHKLLPRVRGGAVDEGGGDGGGGNGDGGGSGDPNDGGTGTGGGNDDDLGDKGKQALDRERRARADSDRARSAAEKERDELKAKLEAADEANKTQAEKDRDNAVREAEERVRKELTQDTNARLVKSEVRVQAASKFADPEDAVRFLDLDKFKVSNDGVVDAKDITSAIDALLVEKPYLASKSKKPQGNADQGARTNGDSNVAPGKARLANAYAQSGTKTS